MGSRATIVVSQLFAMLVILIASSSTANACTIRYGYDDNDRMFVDGAACGDSMYISWTTHSGNCRSGCVKSVSPGNSYAWTSTYRRDGSPNFKSCTHTEYTNGCSLHGTNQSGSSNSLQAAFSACINDGAYQALQSRAGTSPQSWLAYQRKFDSVLDSCFSQYGY